MREAEIQFLKEQNELEIARAKQLSEIEVRSFVVVSWNVQDYYHRFHVWLLRNRCYACSVYLYIQGTSTITLYVHVHVMYMCIMYMCIMYMCISLCRLTSFQ